MQSYSTGDWLDAFLTFGVALASSSLFLLAVFS